MGTPPPVPQGDAVPTEVISQQSPSGAVNQTSGGSQAKPGKGKLIGIILGSVLGVAVIAACIWFFFLKKDAVVEPPAITLADYIRGKRLTLKLPPEANEIIPAGFEGGQFDLSAQPVFMQFGTNNVAQFGTTINNRSVAIEKDPTRSRG